MGIDFHHFGLKLAMLYPIVGMEIRPCPLTQASIKASWGSTNNYSLFVAILKANRPIASAQKVFNTAIALLCLSVEYATKEVSHPCFTVKTLLLSRETVLVSIGDIPFH